MMGGQNAQETAIVDQLTRYTIASGWSTGDTMLADLIHRTAFDRASQRASRCAPSST